MASIKERIEIFNAGRDPKILEYKYDAMCENLFRFYRGSCHIFYEDLANNNLNIPAPASWICGDLHLENFGSYKSDNRLVYFDLNDFDEAVLAPAHFEILRLLTSIFVAFESLRIERKRADKLAGLFIRKYADTLKKGKAVYIERQTAEGIVCDFLKQSGQKKQRDVLDKKTVKTKTTLNLLLSTPKHRKLEKKSRKALLNHMQHWLTQDEYSPYNYKITDCAFRIAGTGSLGLKRYVLLMKSLNNTGAKYMLLDMKQAQNASLNNYNKITQPSWKSEADRIIQIQTRMQNRPPALFSHTCFQGQQYIVQELQPEKDSINFKLLQKRYRDMVRVIADMAVLTASSQIRSSGRQGSATTDELIEFGNDESWQQQLLDYASAYARKVQSDFEEFTSERKKSILRKAI